MSDSLITTGYAVGNVLSSVAIVLVNKKVFAAGFHFPFSLSFFHFCFTMVFYRLLLACGLFQLPTKPMSQLERFKVGAAGVACSGALVASLMPGMLASGLPPAEDLAIATSLEMSSWMLGMMAEKFCSHEVLSKIGIAALLSKIGTPHDIGGGKAGEATPARGPLEISLNNYVITE